MQDKSVYSIRNLEVIATALDIDRFSIDGAGLNARNTEPHGKWLHRAEGKTHVALYSHMG